MRAFTVTHVDRAETMCSSEKLLWLFTIRTIIKSEPRFKAILRYNMYWFRSGLRRKLNMKSNLSEKRLIPRPRQKYFILCLC